MSISLLAVLIIGIADYLTGIDISLAIFYLLPISYVTWFAGRNEGVLLSVLAAMVSFAGDFIFTGRIYSHPGISYWNGVMRGGRFHSCCPAFIEAENRPPAREGNFSGQDRHAVPSRPS